jgi:hypothetical protein
MLDNDFFLFSVIPADFQKSSHLNSKSFIFLQIFFQSIFSSMISIFFQKTSKIYLMSRNNPPDILAAQAKLLEVAQRQTNEEIQKKLEMLGKQVAAAQAHANAQAQRAQASGRKRQEQGRPNPPPYKVSKPNTPPYRQPTKVETGKPRMIEKYDDLVGVIEELGKDVRPTYAGSKSAQEQELNFYECLKFVLHF